MARSSSPHPGATRVCGEASCHAKAPRAARTRGFALLITVTLLAFLVLLLVSLAALTRVETQVASNSQQLAQARQNALVALNIALGQLQKYAGPDQRVTGAADLAGAVGGARIANGVAPANAASVNDVANGLTGVQAGTRFWTGVWGNSDVADDIHTRTPGPVLLNWLVSGNEEATFFATPGTGQVTASNGGNGTVAPDFNPSLTVAGLSNSPEAAALAAVTINGNPARILMGPNTVGATVADADNYVIAPLVSITAPAGAVQGIDPSDTPVIGNYAWWVGDEGVKARINLVDRYAADTIAAGEDTTHVQARVRLQTPLRSGIEAIADFAGSDYPERTQSVVVANNIADRILSLRQAILLNAAQVTPARLGARTHAFTTHSLGLAADSLNGGLRRDLTFYLEQSTLPNWTGTNGAPAGAGEPIIPETVNDTPLSPKGTAATYGAVAAPQWDVMRSFYHAPVTGTTATDPGTAMVRPATLTQMGINPVVTLFRLQVGVRRSGNQFRGLAAPLITLANPYTTKLSAPNGLGLEILFSDEGDADPAAKTIYAFPWVHVVLDKNGAKEADESPASDGSKAKTAGNYSVRLIATRSAGDSVPETDPSTGMDKGPALLSNVKFVIPPGTVWDPGEAKVFTLQEDLMVTTYGAPRTVQLTEGLPDIAFKAVVSPAKIITVPNTRKPDPADGIRYDVYAYGGQGRMTPVRVELSDLVSGEPVKVLTTVNLQGIGTASRKVPDGKSLTALPLRVLEASLAPPADTIVYDTTYRRGAEGQRNGSLRIYQDFNLRSAWFRPTNQSHSIAPYVTRVSPIGSTNLTSDPDGFMMTAFSGDVNPTNPQQWGRSVTDTSSPVKSTLLYDLPRRVSNAEMPVMSIGRLQHANLTADDLRLNVGHQPGYAIGNSYASPFVSRQKSIDIRPDLYYTQYGGVNYTDPNGINRFDSEKAAAGLGNPVDAPYYAAITKNGIKPWVNPATNPSGAAAVSNRHFDMSYLLNASLWDGYFFSTIPQAAVQPNPGARSQEPVNPRLRLVATAGEAATVAGVLDGRKAATHTVIDGAFNINSTSEDAWLAVLGGMKGLPALPLSSSGTATPEAIFPRSLRQSAAGTSSPTGDSDDSYRGFRQLSDDQLATLAQALVKQVRLRGPFTSLAHFVNRALVPATIEDDPNALGFSGALQTAIDTGGLNTFSSTVATLAEDRVEIPPTPEDLGSPTDIGRDIIPTHDDAIGRGTWSLYADSSNFTAGVPTTTVTGATDPVPVAFSRSTSIPGWLTQADVLQVLGPVIAARSDTFTIRTYGEVVNPVTGEITGRAWCEAVVQRQPDYVEPTLPAGNAPEDAGSVLTTNNGRFGRRFAVVAFRWLSPGDI